MDPKNSVKAPKYTKIWGSARRKKQFFWSVFQKVLKNAFFGHFFQNLPAVQKMRPKQGLLSALGELEKSISSTLKKFDLTLAD